MLGECTQESDAYARNIAKLRGGCFQIGLDAKRLIDIVERPEIDCATIVFRSGTSVAAAPTLTKMIHHVSKIR